MEGNGNLGYVREQLEAGGYAPGTINDLLAMLEGQSPPDAIALP